MTLKLVASVTNPPIGGLLAAHAVNSSLPVSIEWGSQTGLTGEGDISFESSMSIARYLARLAPHHGLYGSDLIEETEVDHWLSFSIGPLSCSVEVTDSLAYLERILSPLTYLVSNKLTLADLAIWAVIYENMLVHSTGPHIRRWYGLIESEACVRSFLSAIPDEAKPKPKAPSRSSIGSQATTAARKEEGKFVDLPGAEMGNVVVRFPPEASGYLHIGHAKAALLNQYYQDAFQGKLIMRFDDTNPAKEKVDFEKVILEDVELLQIKPDQFTHTSSYFDQMLEMCETLLREGKAYVDTTEPEQMKIEREQRVESANRNTSVSANLPLWSEMKAGTWLGQRCCVRAKIDMASDNGCMRDPTIYRCKDEPHPRTGTKYKVYPTYDFACPIVDSLEGVTHCLRTMEYHDRDEQFYWFIDALGLRRPFIWEYSRLNMTNTVLSKRKLTWFVDNGLVDGWDDPRLPTVRGVLRRGMTVEGLKQFIIAQGSSRSVVVMEWDKIWAINKKVIDPVAPRYTALEGDGVVAVNVTGIGEASLTVAKHPKDPAVGTKQIWVGPHLRIDQADAAALVEGTNATFINWGNLRITKIHRKGDTIERVDAEANLDDKDYKKTLKLTWLADTPKGKLIPCVCVHFDHIISKAVLGKDEDFKQYIGYQTRTEVVMLGEPELACVKQSEIIQLQRRGFFICDSPYQPPSVHTGKESPIILFAIPDGHSKEMPTALSTTKRQSIATKAKVQVEQFLGEKTEVKSESVDFSKLGSKIIAQSERLQQLKAGKASASAVSYEVDLLLALISDLKENDKNVPKLEKPDAGDGVQPAVVPKDFEEKIKTQGEVVRKLKAKKADKAVIDAEVKVLLELKNEFKKVTGQDWKPSVIPEKALDKISNPSEISDKIVTQGEKVRKLKGGKADQGLIAYEVKVLLELKSEFKKVSGQDWKPGSVTVTSAWEDIGSSEISKKIVAQADKVRRLKGDKADKNVIDVEVKELLRLKGEFKYATGQEWRAVSVQERVGKKAEKTELNQMKAASSSVEAVGDSGPVEMEPKLELTDRINAQGNIVRSLKTSGASKGVIEEALKLLLELKADYKATTGTDFPTVGRQKEPKQAKPPQKPVTKQLKKQDTAKEQSPEEAGEGQAGLKKQTRLGMEAKKEENLPDWYSQVIVKGELIEYYDVSGCYILRPWAFAIWETIRDFFDPRIKQLGVSNCYFPIFVSRNVLEKEKSHIADFSPEVAWVTKSGDSDLAEPIAVRPTSETAMYPAFAKWIQSYRDLPLKLNQWNNVVRWEFKHPQPFLRTREFLWQEGHTAYASVKDAEKEVLDILDLYEKIYTELLAVPVVKGRKTEKEKFAGGEYTTTVEGFISASGRAIQGGTSHHLGQNFSKMFDIIYEDPETQEKKLVYQNSWGITTRTIGVMVMVHADNQGLVLPPRVASIQVVIVPCGISASLKEADRKALLCSCAELEASLQAAGVRVFGDYRDNYSPGWKFNHWELKGVPVRIELGPKDLKRGEFVAVRRDTGEKATLSRNKAVEEIPLYLTNIQSALLQRAKHDMDSHTVMAKHWPDFCAQLEKKNILLSPFCGEIECEDIIKKESARDEGEGEETGAPAMGAKSLCIPFDQPPGGITSQDRCIHPACTRAPKFYTLFGRSY